MPRTIQRLEQLIDIGIALSAEQDSARLMETILIGAKSISNADAGTVYSVIDNRQVRIEIMRTDSLDFAMGGTTGKPIPFPPIPLYSADGVPNKQSVVTQAVLSDTTVNIPDAYDAVGFDFSGTREFDHKTGYRSTSFLTVPMKNHEGDIIGVLQLINARDDDGGIIPFSKEVERLTQALASQAAVALTNKRLVNDLQELFRSFIHMIATAIDQKSPYTGEHCKRVPLLTMLLSEAVHRTSSGPFRDFQMTEKDRVELDVAAWLHDCGKITTPEWVIDKATKLETIFDRVHLVDARFEILRRDAEIALLRDQLAAREQGREPDSERLEANFRATCEALADEQALVHRSNPGGEFMSEQDQTRLQGLAQRRWTDTNGKVHPLLSDDEVANLCIPRGTLTPAERQIINGHITATIDMLDALPFPKHLKNVPEYAGGHHERIDGKGYPKGLKREEMSVQARIMAIADVFEALTASDRPYKSAKKLSEALAILADMARSGHIDPDLFEIFVREKVYLRYAEQQLDPALIDPVEESLLFPARAAAGRS